MDSVRKGLVASCQINIIRYNILPPKSSNVEQEHDAYKFKRFKNIIIPRFNSPTNELINIS